MSKYDINIIPFGPEAILIEWPEKINEDILEDVIQFTRTIVTIEKSKLLNYTPGYNSLLLQYVGSVNFDEKKETILSLYHNQNAGIPMKPKSWHIPVCYEAEFAMDFPIFQEKGLTSEEIINLHISQPYRVYMIGFLPGFLYLGGLPKKLHMPRKQTPRIQIPKGSVAIGGEQTGIYPMDSPGGWQIIGRTPLTLFDINKKNPIPIRQGDIIHFYSIDRETFENLS